LRSGEDLVAVQRDQRLVGGDHVLTVRDRLEHQLARRFVATDQLDDDVHVGIAHHRERVVGQAHAVGRADARCVEMARRGVTDVDATPRAAVDLRGVTQQHVDRTATYGAEAQQADIDRIHDILLQAEPTPRRNMERRPRTAWRVRCSFSISAKRT
jgi:hypothetical protein